MISTGLNSSRWTAGHAGPRAGRVRDLRRAAEITSHDNEHVLVESTLINVFDQGAHRRIEIRAAVFHPVENVMIDGMIVPALSATARRPFQGHGDKFDSRFHQPPSHQALLAPDVSSVAFANSGVFLLDIEGRSGSRPGQNVPRLGL